MWALRKQKRKKNNSNNVTPTKTKTATVTPTKIEKKRSKPPQLMHNQGKRALAPRESGSFPKRLPTKPPIISVLNNTANKPTQKPTKSSSEITPTKPVKIERITPQISEALPVTNDRFDETETMEMNEFEDETNEQ